MTAEELRLLAHELRSPVAALVALAAAAPTARGTDGLARMLALGVAAGRDVERLLTDRDPASIRPAEVDLERVLASLGADDLRDELPAGTSVAGDATRIRQALANLVANARRHGTRVTVAARLDGDAVAIDVSDDGPGVAVGLDPFARGVSGAGSTGYGLWLARAIAEGHGGTLELVDTPLSTGASGATFRLVLPSGAASP